MQHKVILLQKLHYKAPYAPAEKLGKELQGPEKPSARSVAYPDNMHHPQEEKSIVQRIYLLLYGSTLIFIF